MQTPSPMHSLCMEGERKVKTIDMVEAVVEDEATSPKIGFVETLHIKQYCYSWKREQKQKDKVANTSKDAKPVGKANSGVKKEGINVVTDGTHDEASDENNELLLVHGVDDYAKANREDTNVPFKSSLNCHALMASEYSSMHTWGLNSGASFHVTHFIELFVNYNSSKKGIVHLGRLCN